MNFSHYLVAFVASLAGTLAGLGIARASHDDVLKGKRLDIVDDDGKAWITATASGITVLGEDDATSTQIRAQQRAHISFQEGDEVRCTVGLNYKGSAGLGTFYGGRLRAYIASNEDRSILGVFTGEDLKDYSSLFDGTVGKQNAARLEAFEGGSDLALVGKDGKSRVLRHDDGLALLGIGAR